MRFFARLPSARRTRKTTENRLLSGQDAETNRHASSLFDEMSRDMPAEHRGTLTAIGKNLAAIAKRDRERTAGFGGPEVLDRSSKEAALQARRDLHAMGLRYHDATQLLDAVRRGDTLAVELFVLARGVNLSARDADGYSALELARRAGNEQIAALLRGAIDCETARRRD